MTIGGTSTLSIDTEYIPAVIDDGGSPLISKVNLNVLYIIAPHAN